MRPFLTVEGVVATPQGAERPAAIANDPFSEQAPQELNLREKFADLR